MKAIILTTLTCLAALVGPAPAETATQRAGRPMRSSVKLGWPSDAKLLIVHADDAGMCRAANDAIRQAFTDGSVTSCSIMMPCPWAYDFCTWAKDHPEYDFGLHITLTSEWKTYKWRPVSSPKDVPSLCDRQGFLLRDPVQIAFRAKPDDVEREIRAQVKRALAWGVKPSHLDTHMGTVLVKPEFAEAYVKVAAEFGITPFLLEPGPEFRAICRRFGAPVTPKLIAMIKRSPAAKLDDFAYPRLRGQKTYDDRKAVYVEQLRRLKPGISEIVVHPMADTPESRAITDFWQLRTWEGRVFADPDVRQLVKALGIELVSWKDLNRRRPMPKPTTTTAARR